MINNTLIILGMLAAFWSGFYFGYLKREKKPIPIVADLNEFAEEIIDKVKDSISKEKDSQSVSFYD